jgi:hypothetical protein
MRNPSQTRSSLFLMGYPMGPASTPTLPNSQLELIYYIGESSPNSLVLCLDLNERWLPGEGRGRPYIGQGGVEAK